MAGFQSQGIDESHPSARFLHVNEHWEPSRPGEAGERVVLSKLPRGESPIVCRARCLNLVLEGVEHYKIDGRTRVVEPGQFLLHGFAETSSFTRAFRRTTGRTPGSLTLR